MQKKLLDLLAQDEILNNTTKSELSFSPTVEDDGKFIVCRAENPVVSGLFLEATHKLSVVCKFYFIHIFILRIFIIYILFFKPLFLMSNNV